MKTTYSPDLLTGSHLRTYEKIFQHPVSHNLPWRDVLSLFSHLGDVEVETNGHLKVTRNGHALILPTPRTKDVADVDEVIKLRFFLEHSGAKLPVAGPPTASHGLLVIDHHSARLFRLDTPTPEPQVFLPPAPADLPGQGHEARDYFSGKEKSPRAAYFAPVARALQGIGQILIFGNGTGLSSEMEKFAAWVAIHHPDLARRIAGRVPVDEHHLTDAQMLAKTREYFSHPPAKIV